MTTGPAISTVGLGKSFGDTVALIDLDLDVPVGCVFGYLGPNGAGKSTTIRLLMGLIRPTSGSAEVLGHDVVSGRQEVHRRVGYLSGDFAAYRDLTADQYLSYLARLRGGLPDGRIAGLAERFDLDPSRRIGALSHGNRQKVGIIQAFMHDPELLILDEPTQGLDPLMQREFLALVRERRDRGHTVFLSSHILAEVEEVADTVGIIRGGRLVTVAAVDELRNRARRRVELTFADGSPSIDELRSVAGVLEADRVEATVELVVEGSMAEMLRTVAPYGVDRIVAGEVDLEGVFLEYYEER